MNNFYWSLIIFMHLRFQKQNFLEFTYILFTACMVHLKSQKYFVKTHLHKNNNAFSEFISPNCLWAHYHPLWVFRVLKHQKKCLEDLTSFSCLLDEGIPKIWKKLNSHDGFLSYLQNSIWQHIWSCLSLPSKSHRENSISSIFLESPHQVDMKNVV